MARNHRGPRPIKVGHQGAHYTCLVYTLSVLLRILQLWYQQREETQIIPKLQIFKYVGSRRYPYPRCSHRRRRSMRSRCRCTSLRKHAFITLHRLRTPTLPLDESVFGASNHQAFQNKSTVPYGQRSISTRCIVPPWSRHRGARCARRRVDECME